MSAEPKNWRIRLWIGSPRLWLLMLLLIPACGGPPFNSYDPPPTFAYKYTADNPATAYQYPAGSVLTWQHQADNPFHPTFTVTGNGYSSTNTSPFGRWETVNNARWPATWRVTSISGCGMGTIAFIQIGQKLIDGLQCVPVRGGNGSMDPAEYWANEVPHSGLTFSFDPSEIPDGTSATIYFVDEYGNVAADADTWVDSSGTAVIGAPTLDPGQYYVLVEFHDIEYDGVQLELHILNPYVNPVSSLSRNDPDHRRSLFGASRLRPALGGWSRLPVGRQ